MSRWFRQAHADQLYKLLNDLAQREGGPRRLIEATGKDGWPRHGVYFFYENGEIRGNGNDRVVRVGTQALTSTSKATLWGRLRQHQGQLRAGTPVAETTARRCSADMWEPRSSSATTCPMSFSTPGSIAVARAESGRAWRARLNSRSAVTSAPCRSF